MITGYTVLLTIHILAAILWVGGGVSVHLFGRMAQSSGDPQRMLQFSRDANHIGPRFYAPLSVILLIAGIFLVDKAGYDMSDLWVTLGFIGWAVSFAIGIGYYGRVGKKQEELVTAGKLDSPEFLALYKQVANVNLFEIAILIGVIVVMATKPM